MPCVFGFSSDDVDRAFFVSECADKNVDQIRALVSKSKPGRNEPQSKYSELFSSTCSAKRSSICSETI